MAKIVRCLPFYMAEWENGTKVFYPTRDIKPYLPSSLSAERAMEYAEELKEASELLRKWEQEERKEGKLSTPSKRSLFL